MKKIAITCAIIPLIALIISSIRSTQKTPTEGTVQTDESNQLKRSTRRINPIQENRDAHNLSSRKYSTRSLHQYSDNSGGPTEEQIFESAQQKLTDFQTLQDQLEALLVELGDTDDEDFVEHAAGFELPENVVTHYLTEHNEALKEKRSLIAQGYPAKHQDVVAADQRAQKMAELAWKEAVSLELILQTKLKLVSWQVTRMEEMVSEREPK